MDHQPDADAQAPAPAIGGQTNRGRGSFRGRGRGGRTPKAFTGPTEPIQAPPKVTSGLPSPQRKNENKEKQVKTATREDSVFKEAVFTSERTLKPVEKDIFFQPSATGFTPLVNDMFTAYRSEHRQQMSKEFPIALFRYYCSCLFWLRVVGIKRLTGQPLSDEEERIFQTFEDKKLNVPEPIFLALKSLGKIRAMTGDTFVPTFPDMPHTLVGTIPGTLGVVSIDNHSIYEELPVIGATVEALRQRLTGDHAERSRLYVSALAPANTTASVNLQGFARLATCRQEALAFLENLGISDAAQFSSIKNTGVNFKILDTTSEYLSKTETFKLYPCDVMAIPETGSVGAFVQAVPEETDLDAQSRADNIYVYMTSMMQESSVAASVSEAFGLCQVKTNRTGAAADLWQQVCPWSALTFTNVAAFNLMPRYSEDRNLRRNLPAIFQTRRFIAAGDWTGNHRKGIVDRLIHRT